MRLFVLLSFTLSGCATYWQADDINQKLDQLLKNTQRATMSEIFGEQAQVITEKLDTASSEEKQKIDELVAEYQKGNQNVEDVRSSVLGVLGGPDRVVSSGGGIWLRDEGGKKLQTVGRNTKLKNCQRLEDDAIPEAIANNKGLGGFSWGKGEINGKTVIFPWELTMSAFTKEIVENTARRTAQEVIRMAGDKGWRRPVYIQVVTDPKQTLKINHPGMEDEIYVTTEEDAGTAPQK